MVTPGHRRRGPPAGHVLARTLDASARRAVPVAGAVLALLLLNTPLGLPGQAEMQPGLLLGCVFFWSVFRPASMPAVPVFGLGVVCDLLGSQPIGVTALMLLLALGSGRTWRGRLARLGFVAMWLVFAGVAAAALGLEWLLVSVVRLQPMPLPAPVFAWVLALGLYPLLSAVCTRAHRRLA
nr:rod shape-determining protein MreD [uncultured Lichenicoccus sp.]